MAKGKKQDNRALIKELANRVMKHKTLYYAGCPEIPDVEYDAIEASLAKLAPDHPALRFVGAEPPSTSEKVDHAVPMLSLDKTYVEEDLYSWMGDHAVVGMLKVDGNSLSLVYENGKMLIAKTRGNGRVGEKVTDKAQWVEDIPKTIPTHDRVEIRGELYCTEANFVHLAEEFQRLELEKPTSPRNIVAGLLGRKTHYHLARYFNFFAFDLIVDHAKKPQTEEQKLALLEGYGFSLPFPRLCKAQTDAKAYLDYVKSFMEEGELGVDGAVFSYNDLRLHEELGHTSHHPRYKMSFKWQGQTAQTKINAIAWFTSRLGIVTPVAVIEPVFLSGATITNVTLHNASHVKTFSLKAGDTIEVVRSGEVIPKFLAVVASQEGDAILPSHCGTCGTELVFDDVRLRCPNTTGCPAQRLGTIINWLRCVEIDDLSEKRLGQMIELGLVNSISDLYRLKVEDLLRLPQTKEKLAQKLVANIEKSRTVALARFLNGLGISGTGLTSWEKLLEEFNGLEAIQTADVDAIMKVEGFAEKSAQQIVEGLQQRRELIQELLDVGVQPQFARRVISAGPLLGKQIVITGTLSRPRDEIESLIKGAGAKPTSSVSKNTFAVVTEDPQSDSSKMRKARDLGVPIWSEAELMSYVNK